MENTTQITPESKLITQLENRGYLVIKKGELPSEKFLKELDEDALCDYLQSQGYYIEYEESKYTDLEVSNMAFGTNASAEHARLIEVIREKLRFGNPSTLIQIIENAQF